MMGLSYDMKKKNPDLKRNVKFDEDDLGLFMDVQMQRDGPWRRIKPEQARRALEVSGSRRNGPDNMHADEIAGFLDRTNRMLKIKEEHMILILTSRTLVRAPQTSRQNGFRS